MTATDGLATFAEVCWPRLVRALSLHLGDVREAEDVAQEALERAARHWPSVRTMANPTGWVFRAAFNLANSRLRRRVVARRASIRLVGATDHATVDPDVAVVVTVREAVKRLPARQRIAVVLRFVSDMSVRDAALVMDCSEQAVRNLTHRAFETLRDDLGVDRAVSPTEETDHAR